MVNEIGCIHGGALPTQVSCKMTGGNPLPPQWYRPTHLWLGIYYS